MVKIKCARSANGAPNDETFVAVPHQSNNGHAAAGGIHSNGYGPSPPGKAKRPEPGSKGAHANEATETNAPQTQAQGQSRNGNRLLLDERLLVLQPSVAQAVGVDGALVLQQLHFHLADPDNGRKHEDERWIYNTYEQWQATAFPFWPLIKIRRVFQKLEKKHLIVSCQPEGRKSRRKYYRLDDDCLKQIAALARAEAIKLIASKRSKRSLPYNKGFSSEISETAVSKETSARKRVTCSFSLSNYSEAERVVIDAHHRIVCDHDRSWHYVNKFRQSVRDRIDHAFGHDPDPGEVETFFRAVLAASRCGCENEECEHCGAVNIPRRGRSRTLVNLLWKIY